MRRAEPQHIAALAREWIGTPFVHQAWAKSTGTDCLGLIRGIWSELYGAPAVSHLAYAPNWFENSQEELLHHNLRQYFGEIDPDAIRVGAVLLFRLFNKLPAQHVAISGSGDGHMLRREFIEKS